MRKKLLLLTLALLLIAGMAGAGTFAYFTDTETSTGNTFTAGTMDLRDPADAVITITNAEPGATYPDPSLDPYTIYVRMNPASTIPPNHIEIAVRTYDLVDSDVESGGANTAADFTKQIEVQHLWWFDDGPNQNLLSMVNDGADGNIGFISLYDVEAYGVFDNLPPLNTSGTGSLEVRLALPTDLPDANDNKYQGDSIKIRFEFAIAQAAEQDVLTP